MKDFGIHKDPGTSIPKIMRDNWIFYFHLHLVQHILKFPLRYSLWHISRPAQQRILVIWIERLAFVWIFFFFFGLYLQMFLATDFFIFKLEYMRQRENPDFHLYFTYSLAPKSPTQSSFSFHLSESSLCCTCNQEF